MLDTHRLSKIVYIDSKGNSHGLHPEYTKKNGLLCDEQGYVNGPKIRRLYMMAGIISPRDDNSETLMHSVKSNILFLNEYYVLQYGALVSPKKPTKPVLPSKTKKNAPLPKRSNR
jgi:hypothetical protein